MEYIEAKSILMSCGGEWFGAEQTANLYRGCSHGCIYCDSRSDCYAIKRFDTVRVKRNALAILEEELSRKRKKCIVGLGAMSDGYNPLEKELELTRGTLKLLDKYGFGVTLETKSDLVLRDIDILRSIASHSPVNVKISITTPYDPLGKKLEPRAASVQKRFDALRKMSDAGIFCGVLLTPVLPFIEDDSASILSIVERAADSGCAFVYAGEKLGVTLRDSQRVYFLTKAEKLFPGMKDKYCAAYGNDYFCPCQNGEALYTTFVHACEQHGLLYDMPSIVAQNKRPYETVQLSLFDF